MAWLLEEGNPSVRFLALRDLLRRKSQDHDLRAARAAVPVYRPVSAILGRMASGGYWEDSESPYLPKYRSTYWQLIVLGILGCHRSDARVRKACEFVFGLQDREGGFSAYTKKQAMREYEYLKANRKRLPRPEEYVRESIHEQLLSCLTGNVAAALIRIGYADDDRTRKALRWLAEIQNTDGGWLCPYWRAHVNDTHGCFHGTICALEAFSECPRQMLTKGMLRAVDEGAEFLLMHRLFKADHHGFRTINPRWLDLAFPWFSEYTVLRGLDVLTKLGYVDDWRLADARDVLLRKRLPSRTWTLERTFTGRMQTTLEPKGRPSKWITLIAMRSLARLRYAARSLSEPL